MEANKFPTSCDDMPPGEARWLFENGATVVVLDTKAGFEFGIDLNQWTVGENFKGVKMIPPGFHIIYYSSVSKQNEVSPRTSFMHFFKEKEVLVKKWNPASEDMDNCPEKAEMMSENKKELDRFLGVYPYESYKKWVSLTDHISPEALESIVPLSGRLSSAAQFQSEASNSQDRLLKSMQAESNKGEENEPKKVKKNGDGMIEMERVVGSELRFLQIPSLEEQGKLTSAQVSLMSMDHSYKLFSLLGTHQPLRLLAELQLVFVSFLAAQVYDAFEQWKKLVNMFCSCEEALSKQPQLFDQFIALLHYQVKEISEDFFTDIVTKNNFLYDCLSKFFDNVQESSCSEALKSKSQRFKMHLEKKFKYSFELDKDEYAPVIVEDA